MFCVFRKLFFSPTVEKDTIKIEVKEFAAFNYATRQENNEGMEE
jgi:hypothetical protein